MRTRTHILLLASLSLLLLAAAFPALAQGGGIPIALGQIVNGEITNEAPQVLYSYSGQAGDIITVGMTATGGGLDSHLQLLSPIGNPLYADDDGGGNLNALLGPYTLPETGTYTIVASRCCGDSPNGSTGTYTLVVNQASLGNLALDQTTTVDLTDAQPVVYLQVPGGLTAPLFLSSRVIEGATAVIIDIHDPSGMSVNQLWHNNNVTASLDPLMLGAAGNYVFVVRRDLNAGSNQAPTRVAIDLHALNVNPISVGNTVSGTLDDSHPVDYYTFRGTAADLLRLSGQQTTDSQPFDVNVFNMYGYNIGSGSTLSYDRTTNASVFALDPLQLPADDQYLIGIRRSVTSDGMATGTSNYTLTLEPSQLQTLQSGVEVTGTIQGGTPEVDYRFDGTQGQVVKITIRSIDPAYAPNLSVQGPSAPVAEAPSIGGGGGGTFYLNIGGSTPATATYETTLPVTGAYIVRVYNGTFDPEKPAQFGLTVTVSG